MTEVIGLILNRRDFMKTVGLGAAWSLLQGAQACRSGPERKPSIVLILIDDLGWTDAGYLGSSYYETPRLDDLARRGMIFTNAYANAPNCAPSRASLLTGLYPPRHGIYTVGTSARGLSSARKLIPVPNTTSLAPGFATLPAALRERGYATGHFGKWHLGDAPDAGPCQRGFDINVGGGDTGHPRSYFSPYDNENLDDGPPGENLTDRLTEEAVRFIEEHRAGPFFLYLSYYAVHTPLQAKAGLIAKYRGKPKGPEHNHAVYAAMIDNLDANIGHILDTLATLDLSESTLVIFFSDNGGYGPATSMAPLRGSKGMLYEGGIRVPLTVCWPGRIAPGSVCKIPVMGIDLFPTVLDLIGSDPAAVPALLDGISLAPLLRGRSHGPERPLFWHFPAYLEAYDKTRIWRTTPAGAVRLGDWKLIEFFEDGRLELFNLRDDIGEERNMAGIRPEIAQRLMDRLREWRSSLDAPVPREPNPGYRGRRD